MTDPLDQRFSFVILAALILACAITGHGQTDARGATPREYPKEIRGYKLERATIELKRPGQNNADPAANREVITLGEARVVSISPLGVTLEIPIVVAPVKQKGKIDFLSFYDMAVNGTPVAVDDYNGPFELPNDHALILGKPLTVFVATPDALIGAVQELAWPQETWPITGVVYVFGEFKKWIFKGKRVIPVELDRKMRNPLRSTTVL